MPERSPLVGAVAAAVAVAAFLLTPDAEARWLRHWLQGNIEPVTAALCVWAVRRHLDGRPGQAVLLGALAGLTRPEVWPFLVLYAAWLLWRAPRRWWVLVPALAVVPLLWFGGDRLASGNALAGAATAQVLVGTAAQRLVVGLDGALAMVPVPVWVAAAVAVVWGAHRRRLAPALLAAAALAWAAWWPRWPRGSATRRSGGSTPRRRPCCACRRGWRWAGWPDRRGSARPGS